VRYARAIVGAVPADRSIRPPGKHAIAWFSLALVLSLFLLHAGFDTTEGSNHTQTAIHWLETGRLGQIDKPADIFVRAADGLYYPAHELGAILWHVPAAAVVLAVERLPGARLPGTDARFAETAIAFNSLLFSLAIAAGFWKWLEWRFALTAGACLRATTVLMFATMLLPYSRALSDVSSAAAWLGWGLAFSSRATRGGGTGSALLAGICLGAAGATRTSTAVVILPIVALLAAQSPRRMRARHLAALVAGAAPFVAMVLWFNDLRMGSPWMPALLHPQYAIVHPGLGSWTDGVFGTLVSPGKSIFVFSPILLLSLVGAARLWKDARGEAVAILASLVLFLAAHGGNQAWAGDWAWGHRYSIFIIPLLWLPGALLFVRLGPGSRGRRAASALLALSLAVQALPLLVHWQYQYSRMWGEGRLNQSTPWSADNQLTDALRAAPANVARTFGAPIPEPPAIEGMARATHLAATGINIWWITALRAGAPSLAVWALVLTVAALACLAWRRTLRACAGPGVQ
jgi:hypothetical protein